MEALRLKGKIDESGKLILSEPAGLRPGEVEVIVLRDSDLVDQVNPLSEPLASVKGVPGETSSLKTFTEWLLAGVPQAPSDFDADTARWEALKEKHNL